MSGQTVTFTERLNTRQPMTEFVGVVVGRFQDCFVVRVGQGKHQERFLVRETAVQAI